MSIPVPGVARVRKLLSLHSNIYLLLGLDIYNGMINHVLYVRKAIGDVLGVGSWVRSRAGSPVSEREGIKLFHNNLICLNIVKMFNFKCQNQ